MNLKVLDILVKVFSLVFVVFLMIATFAGLFPSLKCDVAALIATISLFIALACANWYNYKQREQTLRETHTYLFTFSFSARGEWQTTHFDDFDIKGAYWQFLNAYNRGSGVVIYNIMQID